MLQIWSFIAPLGPPLATLTVWLLVGDAVPTGGDVHEPWPYRASVAIFSLFAVIVATPLLCLVVGFWVLAEMTATSRAGNGGE